MINYVLQIGGTVKCVRLFDRRIKKGLNTDFEVGTSLVLKESEAQLSQYFSRELMNFDIPFLFVGTDFQKGVWEALTQIPYGKTETYMGLSRSLGNEKAIRAVATANAISILVPCHRIIGSHGDLVGYAGGLSVKKKLLELENPIRKSQLEFF